MSFNQVNTHTFNIDTIVSGGWALDLGCQDFLISRYFLSLGLKVLALDPLKLDVPVDLQQNPDFHYINKACVGLKKEDTAIYYDYYASGANSLYNPPEMLHRELNGGHSQNPIKSTYPVLLTTISELMNEYGIEIFEVIKCDTEGAEYEILENLPERCAKQISIEFHDFLGLTPNVDDLENFNSKINNYWLNPKVISYHKELTQKMKYYNLTHETRERNDVLYELNKKI